MGGELSTCDVSFVALPPGAKITHLTIGYLTYYALTKLHFTLIAQCMSRKKLHIGIMLSFYNC